MSTVNAFQISLEIWGCLLCVVIAIILGDKAYKEGGAIHIVWRLLLLNGFLLSSDAFAYIFRGDTSTFGYYMTRISNFVVFALEGVMTWNIAACVQNLICEDQKSVLGVRWMQVCTLLTAIQLLGIAITPLTNFYYFFDSTNHYHRAAGVNVSFAALGLVCLISAVNLFRHTRELPAGILHIFRTVIPVFGVCFVIQLLEYGISLINVGLTTLLIMLYLGLWKESMRKENRNQMDEIEALMKELMAEKQKQGK